MGGEEGEEECGRSKAPHGCGRRGRISFETESLWDSRRSPGTAGLGCVSADLGMCQLRPPSGSGMGPREGGDAHTHSEWFRKLRRLSGVAEDRRLLL